MQEAARRPLEELVSEEFGEPTGLLSQESRGATPQLPPSGSRGKRAGAEVLRWELASRLTNREWQGTRVCEPFFLAQKWAMWERALTETFYIFPGGLPREVM